MPIAQHAEAEFYLGDTWKIAGTLQYDDGSPFDLSAGASIAWCLKDAAGNTVATASLGSGITVVSAAAGTCKIVMVSTSATPAPGQYPSALVPGAYFDQLRATDPAGVVATQWEGSINVRKSFFA